MNMLEEMKRVVLEAQRESKAVHKKSEAMLDYNRSLRDHVTDQKTIIQNSGLTDTEEVRGLRGNGQVFSKAYYEANKQYVSAEMPNLSGAEQDAIISKGTRIPRKYVQELVDDKGYSFSQARRIVGLINKAHIKSKRYINNHVVDPNDETGYRQSYGEMHGRIMSSDAAQIDKMVKRATAYIDRRYHKEVSTYRRNMFKENLLFNANVTEVELSIIDFIDDSGLELLKQHPAFDGLERMFYDSDQYGFSRYLHFSGSSLSDVQALLIDVAVGLMSDNNGYTFTTKTGDVIELRGSKVDSSTIFRLLARGFESDPNLNARIVQAQVDKSFNDLNSKLGIE